MPGRLDSPQDPWTHRYPANLRRRYDKLKRFPSGSLVIGDAVSSFNPLYGQGMTLAALEALASQECLTQGTKELARRFYKLANRPIGVAWQLATGGHLMLPSVPGRRPLPLRAVNTYAGAVQAAAVHDPAVVTSFLRVTSLQDPPSRLLAPARVTRVIRAKRARSTPGSVAAR